MTVKITRRKNNTLSDGTASVILQVIHERKVKKITLPETFKCTPEEWNEDKREFTRKFESYKESNIQLRAIEARANEIINEQFKLGKAITFNSFEEKFRGLKKKIPTLYTFFDERINEMKAKNELSNAEIYKTTERVLLKFEPNKNLNFNEVNYIFLTRFEAFLKERGNKGSINNYMRTIRALFNEAMKREFIESENFPFKTDFNNKGYSFSHIKSDAKPRALNENDLEKIKNFPISDYPRLNLGYKIFMFSYYARGININDIAKLKPENFYNGRIEYTRTKTKGKFTVNLSENLNKIIEEFKSESQIYIFPILNDFHKTPQQVKYRISKVTKQINEKLKELQKILNIEIPMTTYVARHTFATTLKRKGGDIAKISESLGHRNINTTTAYLKKFENNEIDKLDELL